METLPSSLTNVQDVQRAETISNNWQCQEGDNCLKHMNPNNNATDLVFPWKSKWWITLSVVEIM